MSAAAEPAPLVSIPYPTYLERRFAFTYAFPTPAANEEHAALIVSDEEWRVYQQAAHAVGVQAVAAGVEFGPEHEQQAQEQVPGVLELIDGLRIGVREKLAQGESINIIDTYRDYLGIITLQQDQDEISTPLPSVQRLANILSNVFKHPNEYLGGGEKDELHSRQADELLGMLRRIGVVIDGWSVGLFNAELQPQPGIEPEYDRKTGQFKPETLPYWDAVRQNVFSAWWPDYERMDVPASAEVESTQGQPAQPAEPAEAASAPPRSV